MPLKDELIALGFPVGFPTRLNAAVRFLTDQEFTCIDDFMGAGAGRRLSALRGADLVQASDLAFLQSIKDNRAKKRLEGCAIVVARRPNLLLPYKRAAIDDAEVPADIARKLARPIDMGTGSGPRKAINSLSKSLTTDAARVAWLESARVAALTDSCSASMPSIQSGLRCWESFAAKVLGKPRGSLPPSLNELMAWSVMFRCSRTFSNYLGYVRLGCLLENWCAAVFNDPALARAKQSITKRNRFSSREKMFLQHDTVSHMLEFCYLEDPGASEVMGMLFLVTYVFLLRLPSEALPIVRGGIGWADNGEQAVVYLEDGELCLKLAKRKNKRNGSLLKRACWCSSCKLTCPVHNLWPFFEQYALGCSPFAGITAGKALCKLRTMLTAIGMEKAVSYRCHDLRRGHAKDLQMSGASLYEILAAGEWRSPAFMDYMDTMELEKSVVVEAHMDESSSEDED